MSVQEQINALEREAQELRLSAYHVDTRLVGRRVGPWVIVNDGPYQGFDYDLFNVDVHWRFWCRVITAQHDDGRRITLRGPDEGEKRPAWIPADQWRTVVQQLEDEE